MILQLLCTFGFGLLVIIALYKLCTIDPYGGPDLDD
jgi:hypothetical protein